MTSQSPWAFQCGFLSDNLVHPSANCLLEPGISPEGSMSTLWRGCNIRRLPFLSKRLCKSWHQTEPQFPFLPNIACDLFSYPLIICEEPIQVLRRKMQHEPTSSLHSFERETWEFPIIRAKIDPELHWLYGVPTKCQTPCLSLFHHSLVRPKVVQHGA